MRTDHIHEVCESLNGGFVYCKGCPKVWFPKSEENKETPMAGTGGNGYESFCGKCGLSLRRQGATGFIEYSICPNCFPVKSEEKPETGKCEHRHKVQLHGTDLCSGKRTAPDRLYCEDCNETLPPDTEKECNHKNVRYTPEPQSIACLDCVMDITAEEWIGSWREISEKNLQQKSETHDNTSEGKECGHSRVVYCPDPESAHCQDCGVDLAPEDGNEKWRAYCSICGASWGGRGCAERLREHRGRCKPHDNPSGRKEEKKKTVEDFVKEWTSFDPKMYYTKQEIDERMKAIMDIFDESDSSLFLSTFTELFRKEFL